MPEENKKELSQEDYQKVRHLVDEALARCDRLGIAWEDYYCAMSAEHQLDLSVSTVEMLRRAFRRLECRDN